MNDCLTNGCVKSHLSPYTLCAFALAASVLLLAAFPLHAAEHVTLTNGFDLVCDHRQAFSGKVRLYTTPGSEDFIEVDAAEIASVDTVPDPSVVASGSSPVLSSGEEKPTDAEMHEWLAKAGAQHNLDADLLASVVQAESGGHARAISSAGAQGLMQLMPKTAAELGVNDSFRPQENIDGGTAYLDTLLLRYHDNLALALAAYNAGPAAVDKYRGLPPYRETRIYVVRVIREFNRRKAAEASLRLSLHAAGNLHAGGDTKRTAASELPVANSVAAASR